MIKSMTSLTDLIERVRTGTGEDRELDAAIFAAVGTIDEAHCKLWCGMDGRTDLTREQFIAAWAPPLTTSLDAVVRLVEEKLGKGEAEWFVARSSVDGPHQAGVRCHTGQPQDDVIGTNPKTPARALLHSLLLALQAQEAEGT